MGWRGAFTAPHTPVLWVFGEDIPPSLLPSLLPDLFNLLSRGIVQPPSVSLPIMGLTPSPGRAEPDALSGTPFPGYPLPRLPGAASPPGHVGADVPGLPGDSPNLPSCRSEPPAWTHPLLPQFPLSFLCVTLPQFPRSHLSVPLLPQCPLSCLSFPSCLAGWIWGIPKGGFGAFQRTLCLPPSLRGSGNTGRGSRLSCA